MRWALGIWSGLGILVLIFGMLQVRGSYTLDYFARDIFILGIFWAIGVGLIFGVRALLRPPARETQPVAPSSSAPTSADVARRPCPQCGELIPQSAKLCRFCRADLTER